MSKLTVGVAVLAVILALVSSAMCQYGYQMMPMGGGYQQGYGGYGGGRGGGYPMGGYGSMGGGYPGMGMGGYGMRGGGMGMYG